MVKGTFLRKENRRESWKRQKEKHKDRKRNTKTERELQKTAGELRKTEGEKRKVAYIYDNGKFRQMIPHKRIERLMELYDVYCRTKDPDARLFLVGSISEVPEYYTYLEEYRKKLGYKENQIIMTGHVAFNEMIAYYRIADAFVCMSEEEGFGMALVEAMFYHVPVVAYESGAVPETLGGSGVLLPTCKPDEIAEVLDSVIRNPVTREQIITGQLRRVESFIESKPRRELIRVLESIQK